jgi:hypothetical protein
LIQVTVVFTETVNVSGANEKLSTFTSAGGALDPWLFTGDGSKIKIIAARLQTAIAIPLK